MFSSVASSSFTSCTLAPLATSDSGTPRASTSRLRLRPIFSPVRGVGPYALLRQRRLAHASIDALPTPANAFHLVVLGQPCLPKTEKETSALPAQKVGMNRARTAELMGQCLPLATRTQHIDNGAEDLPRGHGLASPTCATLKHTSRRPLNNRNKRFDLGPKLIRNCPGFHLNSISFIYG